MAIGPKRLALGLAGFLAGDAVANAIPLPVLKADLDRLGCSDQVQRAIPIVKGAAAAGLVIGLKMPRLERLTAFALVGYFVCAIGVHVKAHDHAIRSAPAAAVGLWAAALAFRRQDSRAAR